MNFKELHEILDIAQKYAKKGEESWPISGAEHDIIYLDISIETVPEDSEDGKRLDALGCHVQDEESWAMFV